MALTKLTTDLIDSTIVTSINGSTGAVTLETGTDWQATPKTADFTAVAGEGYFVNTTSAAITVTLPSSPSTGEEVSIIDYGANAATNNITITSSDNIEGASDDLVLSTDKVSKTLVYSDATKGWLVANDGAAPADVPSLNVEYLVVAGGGGSGARYGGGGGAGGYLSNYDGTPLTLAQGIAYTVTVGAGGAGGTGGSNGQNGNSGSNSVFSTITSTGGGFGQGADTNVAGGAGDGGSGGGGSAASGMSTPVTTGGAGVSGPPRQGYDGGDYTNTGNYYYAGGGGGASEVGESASTTRRGDGGDGLPNGITGTSTYYAGGGGGGSHNPPPSSGGGAGGLGGGGDAGAVGSRNTGNPGIANTGGGAGGGSTDSSGSSLSDGAAGGSGVVIVRYPDYYDIVVGSGLTTGQLNTTVGSNEKYTTFTGGTGNITFSAA